ncbi:MAG: twin-arginine translocation signal domain-containing protein, partial [Planctomycetaceae bacterium]|nr:twin-arginine translocation signal domain-containing protein [Planctomycetaceae bacterium]
MLNRRDFLGQMTAGCAAGSLLGLMGQSNFVLA